MMKPGQCYGMSNLFLNHRPYKDARNDKRQTLGTMDSRWHDQKPWILWIPVMLQWALNTLHTMEILVLFLIAYLGLHSLTFRFLTLACKYLCWEFITRKTLSEASKLAPTFYIFLIDRSVHVLYT